METRRIKARNGEGLTFTAVGLWTGPLGELFDPLDEKPRSRRLSRRSQAA